MRIALISDTHVPKALRALPPSLLEALRTADHILHAGDLVAPEVLRALEIIAPTTAVAGNMDPPEVSQRIHASEVIELGGRIIGLKHGHQRHSLQNQYIGLDYEAPEFDIFYHTMQSQLADAEIIVFGHFHAPLIKRWNGTLFVNPGSVAPPHRRATYAMLTLGNEIDVELRTIDGP